MNTCCVLFHPVGLIEMGQIVGSNFSRLPENARSRHRFYATPEEAEALVREELVESLESAFVGYVVRVMVDPDTIGSLGERPLTLDNAALAILNANLDGPLRVQSATYGSAYHGYIPEAFRLAGQEVGEQFLTLWALTEAGDDEGLADEIGANHRAIYLNYPYWVGKGFAQQGLDEVDQEVLLANIEHFWADAFPDIILYRDVTLL